MVVAGAILTGTLVVGRNYGPTYYAQYGGNLQQAGMIIKFNVFIQCEKSDILICYIVPTHQTVIFLYWIDAQRPGEENYELYYNHEDRNYYYRQKVCNNKLDYIFISYAKNTNPSCY